VVEDRPDLAIVDGELWARVQTRLRAVREAYGATNQQRRPRGQAPEVYSPHLLSGLMRCAICGARITIQSSQRKKHGTVYRYGRYRCSFHVTKGPAVCTNAMSIPQLVLEAKLLAVEPTGPWAGKRQENDRKPTGGLGACPRRSVRPGPWPRT
jgi:hypothetical protein